MRNAGHTLSDSEINEETDNFTKIKAILKLINKRRKKFPETCEPME
jgi:hypothetical protein